MQDNWVDFKAVKSAVSMKAVLGHYGVNWLRKSGQELRGRCPIHQGEGQDTFHVNIAKNAFQCFSCKARGNVLDFVAAMENCSVRDAAVKLKEWFGVRDATAPPGSRGVVKPSQAPPVKSEGAVNKPLSFQLKGVDPSHPYLTSRGFSKRTLEVFGVGFFSGKGSMTGRVVIPIHNECGELVAYAGRSVDGSEPKYKLPAGFHKSLELFNLHRVIAASARRRTVVVGEGFFDCMRVTEAGFPCVALMGSSLSQRQEELLVKHFKAARLVLDGDDAGRQATNECLARLGRRMWVTAAVLTVDTQPDQLSTEELKQLLSSQ